MTTGARARGRRKWRFYKINGRYVTAPEDSGVRSVTDRKSYKCYYYCAHHNRIMRSKEYYAKHNYGCNACEVSLDKSNNRPFASPIVPESLFLVPRPSTYWDGN